MTNPSSESNWWFLLMVVPFVFAAVGVHIWALVDRWRGRRRWPR